MILYFIFLFLVPFQEHPIFGAQLFHLGPFPVTPIKLVGIPLVSPPFCCRGRAMQHRGQAPRILFCLRRSEVSGSRDNPVF